MDEYLAGIMDRSRLVADKAAEPFVVIQLIENPVGKGRAKFSNAGQFVRVYTPAKTVKYENKLKAAALIAMNGRHPIDEACSVTIHVFVPVPASWNAKKRAAALSYDLMPISRPDIDNYEKAILDGFNKVVWTDDSRIVSMNSMKMYGEMPRVEVTVWRWDGT